MKKRFLPLLFVPALLVGCSTMKNGTTQEITFNSEPQGAEIYEKRFIGDKLLGVTPMKIKVSRGINKVVVFKKEGFKPQPFIMNAEVEKATYANAANLMVGSSIDGITGARYRFKNDEVFVELKPEE